ncbi:MAG: PH domain-containing protein [Myxococcaceae bacterium]|nr:PH domain-containing protein [Myxococcaceae bacterium]MCI0672737.1 PH domain-containing protein [Myxococcaceae bacterium]
MDARGHENGRQVFRPSRILATLTAVSGLLWLGVFVYLCTFRGVPLHLFASVVFFVALFAVATVYYGRSAIVVEGSQLTYRGMVRTLQFGFQDIRKLDVLPSLITVYAIRLPGRLVHFTSLFPQHRRLAQLLVEQAGLAPLRA